MSTETTRAVFCEHDSDIPCASVGCAGPERGGAAVATVGLRRSGMSTETKWTPGPESNVAEVGPRKYFLMLVGTGSVGEVAADLAKLKAAPKMYEALRAALAEMEGMQALYDEDDPESTFRQRLAKVRAALAAADGREAP
jgi:hypothetical protein